MGRYDKVRVVASKQGNEALAQAQGPCYGPEIWKMGRYTGSVLWSSNMKMGRYTGSVLWSSNMKMGRYHAKSKSVSWPGNMEMGRYNRVSVVDLKYHVMSLNVS